MRAISRRTILTAISAPAWPKPDDAEAPVNTLTPEEQRGGWRLLFDGASSEGWEEVTGKPFPSASWRIENGCLRAFSGGGGMQDIRTSVPFAEFELQFEWKVGPAGNSGVKYFIQRVDEWTDKSGRQARGRGFEYQLAAPDAPEARSDATRACGALYGVLAPNSITVARANDFNSSGIVVRSGSVEHWLNGQRVLAYRLEDSPIVKLVGHLARPGAPPEPRHSHIVLQNHRSDAWFRNIKIRQPE